MKQLLKKKISRKGNFSVKYNTENKKSALNH